MAPKNINPAKIFDIIATVQQLGPNEVPVAKKQLLDLMLNGTIEAQGLMPWSSNYTFLVALRHAPEGEEQLAIYKPSRGERPLWDFPRGTLCYREFLSYLFSQMLGWPNIPLTVLRDGPEGLGSVQRFIDADYEAHYFNMQNNLSPNCARAFQQLALFDVLTNNADRKGGHCLKAADGTIWGIDHGLTFHTDFKLRTVIHEYCEEDILPAMLKDLMRLQTLLTDSQPLQQILGRFLSPREIEALIKRLDKLVRSGRHPRLNPYNVPYPPI